ncbi:Kelch repeat-containing protein [Bacillus infantis]|uniref:Kelch repeat-containing protein n=1 Tax=Bacillus infantis TaxID=324767 RepID=UPI003CF524C6
MTTGRVNVGGGGGGATLNIYTQLAEPQKKDGIWLQTTDKFKTIFQDLSVYLANSWVVNAIAPLPLTRGLHATVLAGDFIYVFGGRQNSSSQSGLLDVYKYNIKTNLWSYVGPLPYGSINSAPTGFTGVYKNGIIYLFGMIGSGTPTIKRFQVSTETWLANTSYALRASWGEIFDYGPDELLVVMPGASTYIFAYKISTDSWRQVNTNTYNVRDLSGSAVHLIDNKIWFIGSNNRNTLYYDLLLNTWTSLAASPIVTSASPSLVFGNEIHIYSRGGYEGLEYLIYNTTNNTYSYGPSLSRQRFNTDAVFDPISKKVYIIGGSTSSNGSIYSVETDMFTYISKQYSNDELVLLVNPPYSSDPKQMAVQLFGTRISVKNMKFLNYFLNAWIFKNGDLKEYPAYYGDGTKWTKFKN